MNVQHSRGFRIALLASLVGLALPAGAADGTIGAPGSQGGGAATTDATGSGSSTAPTTGAAANPANPNNAESRPTAGPGSTSPSSSAPPHADSRKIFDQLDSDRDGKLSFEEFSRATIRQQ